MAGNNKMKLWKYCEVTAAAISVISFCLGVYLSIYFANTRPGVPIPSADRIYFHDVHGKIAYLTRFECRSINALFWISGFCFVVAAIIDRYKRPFQ